MSESSDNKIASAEEAPIVPHIHMLPDDVLCEIFSWGVELCEDISFSFLVSTVCKSWRSVAINDSRLWTTLNMSICKHTVPLPIPPGPSILVSSLLPRADLIAKRSGNQDIDFHLTDRSPINEGPLIGFAEIHYSALSQILANIAPRLREIYVTVLDWRRIYHLSTRLMGIAMPKLETCYLDVVLSDELATLPTYTNLIEPVYFLQYAYQNYTPTVTSQDLKERSSVQYPALKFVQCSAIPLDWGLFCASNLTTLRLQNQPWMERVQPDDLRGILYNSRDTLEVLELRSTVALLADDPRHPPSAESRLTLPHVETLDLVYTDPYEAQQVLRGFDFPALRALNLKNHDEDINSSNVLVDVLKYVRVEELLSVRLSKISLPQNDFPEPELNGAAEDSLPLILQFLRRFIHGIDFMLEDCSDDFLRFMNYRYWTESGGGKINLSALTTFIVKVYTEEQSVGVMSFIRNRLELGTVNGVYVGPVMDRAAISVEANVQKEARNLGDLKLAKDMIFSFWNGETYTVSI